jgi:Tfp pilus assembly protein PilF
MGFFDFLKPKQSADTLKMGPNGMPYMEKASSGPLSFDDIVEGAMGLNMTGRPKEALAAINKALAMKSDNADAYHIRGSIKHDMGDVSGACSDWKKANSLGGNANDMLRKYCK